MESLNNTTPHITSVDIDEQVYRSDPAIAASDLKYAIDHGLEAFNIYKYGKNNPPRIATPAMKLGSMIHKWILEDVGRVTSSIYYDQFYEFLIQTWKWVSIRKSN